jgi:hypothetical protein
VTNDVVVTNYAGPIHGFKSTSGAWLIGLAATTASQDTPGADNVVVPTYSCGDPNAGDCATPHGNGYCADSCCCAYVCAADAFCCDIRWDSICASKAAECATNCTGSSCPADFDGDQSVGGADLGLLLGDWGGTDRDLNVDGVVNGADLGLLLGAWGPCQ